MGRRREATRLLQLHAALFDATEEDHLNLFFRLADEGCVAKVRWRCYLPPPLNRPPQAVKTFLRGAEIAKSKMPPGVLEAQVELMRQDRAKGATHSFIAPPHPDRRSRTRRREGPRLGLLHSGEHAHGKVTVLKHLAGWTDCS